MADMKEMHTTRVGAPANPLNKTQKKGSQDRKEDRTVRLDANTKVTRVDGTNRADMGRADISIIGATNKTYNVRKSGKDLIPSANISFLLKGKEYTAVKSISESTGEGQIILVQRANQQYVLKLYYPNFHYKEEIIRSVWNMDSEFVMKVYDYGKTMVNGSERDYELMEFLRGGTLATYQLGENLQRFRHLALQAAAALASLHNWGIIHKDIKPGNFFFRDADGTELVLGDFGISSKMKEGEDLLRTSQARTPAFAAPEMYDDVIDGEVEIDQRVDYYSLGITLLYLWLGHSPFGRNERLMMRMKQEGRLPHINELPTTVSNIIRGLTSINSAKRWGFNEVERWFKGEEVAVDTSSAYLRYKTFILDAERNLSAHDVKELVPLLHSNPEVGRQFLYSKRISQWLDECGNAKMAVLLNDIVDNRYPSNQQAGLAAAIYTLEPNFPYYDLHGQICESLRDIAVSLLTYIDEYLVVLQDLYNPLFSFIESKGGYNMERLRGYFRVNPSRESILKLVFEIDAQVPFLNHAPSEDLKQIVSSFATERTEDEWLSLIDGRLLAWLYARHEIALCEITRQWMERTDLDERTRAWTLLYNLDRTCGFDLADVKTEVQVARIMARELLRCQNLEQADFEREMHPFISQKGRLYAYAGIHNWTRVKELIEILFNFEASENKDRFQLYDIYTASYKLCTAMGGVPSYEIRMEEGTVLVQGINELKELPIKAVRDELRQGRLVQWMSIFFHEHPLESFSEPYEYERALESFLLTLGTYDSSEMHYKRYTKAEEQMARKLKVSRREWETNIQRQKNCMYSICVLSVIWILFILFGGIPVSTIFQQNIYYYVGIPVGSAAALVLVVWSYFRGHGFLICLLWAMTGLLSSLIPAAILDVSCRLMPSSVRWVTLLLSIIYIGFALRACFRKTTAQLEDLSGIFSVDDNKALLEKMFYTFKTKSFKFKGSNFGMLDDVVDESRAASYEKLLTCTIWGVMLLVLVLLFIWYHPSMLNHPSPDIFAWKTKIWNLYFQH